MKYLKVLFSVSVLAVLSIVSCGDPGSPVIEEDKAPGAPTDITAVAGDQQVTVGWTAPADTGITGGDGTTGAITKYTVYWGAKGVDTNSEQKADVTSGTTYTITTGLTNGEEVFFIVTAWNGTGQGAPSTEESATPVPPADRAPGAPTDITATPGDRQVTVGWTAPTDTGITGGNGTEGVITKYTVYWGTSPGVTSATAGSNKKDTADGNPLSLVIDQLINDTPYYFIVTAWNGTGQGAPSTEESATPVPPADRAPGAPTDITATPGDRQVTVGWTAPTDTGITGGNGTEGVITKYTVYWGTSPGVTPATAGSNKKDTADGNPLSLVIDQLINDTPYYFIVTAWNDTGESEATAEQSATAIPADRAPGAPTITTATSGDPQVTVSWTAPTDTGITGGNGTAGVITKYTVYWGTSAGVTPTTAGSNKKDTADGNTLSLVIDQLQSDTPYYFIVTAWNDTGESEATAEQSATPVIPADRAPGAPTITTATSGNPQVTVSWTAPTDTGITGGNGTTGVITKYTVYWGASGVGTDSAQKADVTSDTTYTITTGLTSDTEVFFIVTAWNETGESEATAEQSATPVIPADRAPGAPTSIMAVAVDQQVTVNWTAPTDTGIIGGNGSTGVITKYTVYWGTSTGVTPTTAGSNKKDTADGRASFLVIDSLTNGTKYYFIVTAWNDTGESEPTVEGSATPEAPSVVYALGDAGPAGGTVIHDKGSYTDGWRYLEAAPSEQEFCQWGSVSVGTTETTIGSGKANTDAIVAALGENENTAYAAKECSDLDMGGYTDWFLPSKDELNALLTLSFIMREEAPNHDFPLSFSSGFYWSSSESGVGKTWVQETNYGTQLDSPIGVLQYTRAVRAF